jgi:hypothetical protein
MGSNPQTCPAIDHLACKLPGELEPRLFDVYAVITGLTTAAGILPHQNVDIANRDAPWHLAGMCWAPLSGDGNGGRLAIRVYDSRGFAISDNLLRAGNLMGGDNAAMPVNPSLVWPVNSTLAYDVQNVGTATANFALFFFGFKIFDRGKAPC